MQCEIMDVGAFPWLPRGVVWGNGGVDDYEMKVIKQFRKCLNRQVFEDIRMQACVMKGGTLLNSKNEYYTPKSVQVIYKQWWAQPCLLLRFYLCSPVPIMILC